MATSRSAKAIPLQDFPAIPKAEPKGAPKKFVRLFEYELKDSKLKFPCIIVQKAADGEFRAEMFAKNRGTDNTVWLTPGTHKKKQGVEKAINFLFVVLNAAAPRRLFVYDETHKPAVKLNIKWGESK